MIEEVQGSGRQEFLQFLTSLKAYMPPQKTKAGWFTRKKQQDTSLFDGEAGFEGLLSLIETSVYPEHHGSSGRMKSFLAVTEKEHRIVGIYGDVMQRLGYESDESLLGIVMSSLCTYPDDTTGEREGDVVLPRRDGICFHVDLPVLHKDGHAEFFDIVRIPLKFLGIPLDLLILKEIGSRTVERARLHEREKELKCLYRVSELTRYSDRPTEHVLQSVVDSLPAGFQYPVSTWCRISWNNKIYTSGGSGSDAAPWFLEEKVSILESLTPMIVRVYYTKEFPEADLGPFLNEEKDLLGAVAALIGNFLTQRDSEAAMDYEKNQIRSLFSGIDDVIYVSDPETYELLYLNDTGRSIWGEDILGKRCHKALQDRDEPCPFCTNHLIMGDYYGRSYVWEFQNEMNKRWYRCSDKAIRWSDGRIVRFEIAGDITWQKEVEQQQEEMTELLLRSNQELEQFAYVASHDLQEPLRMVSSYTQLLSQRYADQLDEKAHSYINYAVDGAIRMQQLINDLLEFSRVTTRGREFVQTDSHAVLGRVIVNLGKLIEEEQALITNDDLPMVMADPMQLTQLLQNLVANGIKFHDHQAPRIHVSVEQDKDPTLWRFAIHDNGIGIDPEYQEKVFIIFQRLHSRKEYPGSGIGLALCKKIIERHGGRIWFESKSGEEESGTTFYFTMKKG